MKKEVISYKNPKSPISEVFRTLRTNIQFMNVDKKMKVLLVTSTFPGEGKSWVVSNLAVTFAQAGKKVVIIDSDMRRGRQYAIFGLSPKPGLSNFLSQVERVSDYVQETEIENLYVMTAGSVPPNPSELLVSAQMIRLLEELRNLCDIVIIDGTPSELVTDSVILSRLADSTIIVTAHKSTKKDALERVVKNIKNVGGKIAGVVINKVPVSARKYGDRYYYYGEDKKTSKESNKKAKKIVKKFRKEKEIDDFIENISEPPEFNEPVDNGIDVNETTNMDKNMNNFANEQNNLNNSANNENNSSNFVNVEEKVSTINYNETENNKQENVADNTKIAEPIEKETISIEKTNDILKQINDYLQQEKKN